MGYIKSLEQQMLFISLGFLPSCLNFGYKEMLSLVDVLQIAVVIYWVGFLLVLIFMQKFRYLCLTKSIKFCHFQLHPLETTELKTNWPHGFLSCTVIFSGNIAFVVLVSFSWIPLNIFQIWSKLAAWLSRICLGIWANQKLRIATVLFLKNINKTNALFSVTSLSR